LYRYEIGFSRGNRQRAANEKTEKTAAEYLGQHDLESLDVK